MPRRFWMLGGGGRAVPGPAALLDSTNAAQRQKRSVPRRWGGTGGIAALRRRGQPFRAGRRRRALHCPRWRSHIHDRIFEFEYLVSRRIETQTIASGEKDICPLSEIFSLVGYEEIRRLEDRFIAPGETGRF